MCKRSRKEKLGRKDGICETEVVLRKKRELTESQTLIQTHSHRKLTLKYSFISSQ